MNKIILFILMFCSFSYVAAFDKVPITGLAAPSPDLISKNGKFFKIKKVGAKNEFPAVALSVSDFSDATMEEHDAFPLSSFKPLGIKLFATSDAEYPYKLNGKSYPVGQTNIIYEPFGYSATATTAEYTNSATSNALNADNIYEKRIEHDAGGYTSTSVISADYTDTTNATTSNNATTAALQPVLFKPIEKAKYLSSFVNTDKERPEYDAIYYISASNTDANDTALTATLIKNIEVTYFSSTYNTDKERTPYDAIYYTSVVAADKYAKPTMKTAIIVTKNIQSAKGYTHTDGKILSSFNSLIAISDNAEIKYETKIGPMNADVFAYNPYLVIIGNEHKPVASSKIDTMAFGHSDYGA